MRVATTKRNFFSREDNHQRKSQLKREKRAKNDGLLRYLISLTTKDKKEINC